MPAPSELGTPVGGYGGTYRGVIEALSDPEQRKRARVRVLNIHPPEVEVDHLPWAEMSVDGGSLFGDIIAYEVGDWVWIMFEAADCRFPVILRGILNFDGGVPPLPSEQTGDYDRTSMRWTRIDRVGNKIEMSPLDEELWVRVETPDGSSIQVSAKDGTIILNAQGRVQVIAPAVQIVAAESVTAETKQLVADVEDLTTLRCRGTVNIRAQDEMNIGEYQPPTADLVPPQPETSLVINIKAAQTIKIESADLLDVDAAGEIQVDTASKMTVHSVSDLTLKTDALLNIESQGDATINLHGKLIMTVDGDVDMDVTGSTTIDHGQKIVINGSNDIEINATANFKFTAGGMFDIEGNASITLQSGGSMDFQASGLMSFASGARIELSAPVVTIDADSLAEVLSGSVVRIDGASVNLIG